MKNHRDQNWYNDAGDYVAGAKERMTRQLGSTLNAIREKRDPRVIDGYLERIIHEVQQLREIVGSKP